MQKSPDSRAVIRLFGRLEAWGRNGQPIEFHSERSKQLLAALVLEKGVPVRRDVLVASLWSKGEEEPRAAPSWSQWLCHSLWDRRFFVRRLNSSLDISLVPPAIPAWYVTATT
jgi:hypothetical protein